MNLSDLQKIKEQVSIRDVAESLLHLEKQDGKYKYPGERTASIQLYTDTQSFNDFGRNVGGDIFKLVSHIEGIDFKESLDEMALRMDDLELLDLAFGFVRGCYNQQIKKEQEAENNGEM